VWLRARPALSRSERARRLCPWRAEEEEEEEVWRTRRIASSFLLQLGRHPRVEALLATYANRPSIMIGARCLCARRQPPSQVRSRLVMSVRASVTAMKRLARTTRCHRSSTSRRRRRSWRHESEGKRRHGAGLLFSPPLPVNSTSASRVRDQSCARALSLSRFELHRSFKAGPESART
jgi:hypothetical protein